MVALLVRFISGSRSPVLFLVELDAAINSASTALPALSISLSWQGWLYLPAAGGSGHALQADAETAGWWTNRAGAWRLG